MGQTAYLNDGLDNGWSTSLQLISLFFQKAQRHLPYKNAGSLCLWKGNFQAQTPQLWPARAASRRQKNILGQYEKMFDHRYEAWPKNMTKVNLFLEYSPLFRRTGRNYIFFSFWKRIFDLTKLEFSCYLFYCISV